MLFRSGGECDFQAVETNYSAAACYGRRAACGTGFCAGERLLTGNGFCAGRCLLAKSGFLHTLWIFNTSIIAQKYISVRVKSADIGINSIICLPPLLRDSGSAENSRNHPLHSKNRIQRKSLRIRSGSLLYHCEEPGD